MHRSATSCLRLPYKGKHRHAHYAIQTDKYVRKITNQNCGVDSTKSQQERSFQCCAVARIETINNLIPSQKLARKRKKQKGSKERQRHDENRHPTPLHVKMEGIAGTPNEKKYPCTRTRTRNRESSNATSKSSRRKRHCNQRMRAFLP
jgi:hypothetical protein